MRNCDVRLMLSKVIKKPRKGGQKREQLERSLRREVSVMQRLRHPNVVTLWEVINDPRSRKARPSSATGQIVAKLYQWWKRKNRVFLVVLLCCGSGHVVTPTKHFASLRARLLCEAAHKAMTHCTVALPALCIFH